MMGKQIIKQPNGLYGVFSSVVDDWIMSDCTPEDIIQDRIEEASEEIRRDVMTVIAALDRGEPVYVNEMTWEEANALRDRIYGEDEQKGDE